jgi:hypothetical protein
VNWENGPAKKSKRFLAVGVFGRFLVGFLASEKLRQFLGRFLAVGSFWGFWQCFIRLINRQSIENQAVIKMCNI